MRTFQLEDSREKLHIIKTDSGYMAIREDTRDGLTNPVFIQNDDMLVVMESQYGIKILPWPEPKRLETKFNFYINDEMPAFGAYATGSVTAGEPVIFFNVESAIKLYQDESASPDKLAIFHDCMLQILTHEFCHAMQEWLGLAFDEFQVEKILGAYSENWNVLKDGPLPEDEGAVFRIDDMLKALDNFQLPEGYSEHYHLGCEMLKDQIREIFKPYTLWHEAEKKRQQEEQIKKD